MKSHTEITCAVLSRLKVSEKKYKNKHSWSRRDWDILAIKIVNFVLLAFYAAKSPIILIKHLCSRREICIKLGDNYTVSS